MTTQYTDIMTPIGAVSNSTDGLQRRYVATLLLLIPAVTVFGNVLVIVSIAKVKQLQTQINYLILGLAIADLLVAVAVMPFAVYVEVNGGSWFLGILTCDLYCATDVVCSTASIFLLVLISFDRFRAATQPLNYMNHSRNKANAVKAMIIAWSISILIASPMVLGLNDFEGRENLTECRFYNPEFGLYSSLGSFYVPTVIILVLYYRIYRVIQERQKFHERRKFGSKWLAPAMETVKRANNPKRSSLKKTISSEMEESVSLSGGSNYALAEFIRNTCSPIKKVSFMSESPSFAGQSSVSYDGNSDKDVISFIDATPCTSPASFRPSLKSEVDDLISSSEDENIPKDISQNGNVIKQSTSTHTLRSHTVVWQIPAAFPFRFVHRQTETATLPASNHSTSESIVSFASNVRKFSGGPGESPGTWGALNQIFTRSKTGSVRRKRSSTVTRTGSSIRTVPDITIDEPDTDTNEKKTIKKRLLGNKRPALTRSSSSGGIKRKISKVDRKERRATKTLAVVLGVFLICWVPFFLTNTTNAICIKLNKTSCQVGLLPFIMSTWLGYMNSFMNPIIYTIFSGDFRRAFKFILCGCKRQR